MDIKIKDIIEKKEMLVIDVFWYLINYFWDLMVNMIDKKGIGVKMMDIKWVLIVFVMWLDLVK